jgi:DNA-binding NarL/FixJ family response regulator
MYMRILLADNQSRTRFALRALLGQQPHLVVVGEAADAEGVLALVESLRPDMVLLGWELKGLHSADLLSALGTIRPQTIVIVLSSRPEVRQAALAAGADAFVSKIDPPGRLLMAIDDCQCGSGGRLDDIREEED